MKQFMSIKEYCEETGFSEKTMRRLVHSYKAILFCRRTSDSGKFLINTLVFERMWQKGEFKSCL